MLAFGGRFASNPIRFAPIEPLNHLVTEGVTILRSKLSASFPVHLPSYILKLLPDAHD